MRDPHVVMKDAEYDEDVDRVTWNVKRENNFVEFELWRPNRENLGDHGIVSVMMSLPPELNDERVPAELYGVLFLNFTSFCIEMSFN